MRIFRASRAIMACGLVFLLCSAKANAASDFMTVGSETLRPIGHEMFCKEHADECAMTLGQVARPVVLRPEMIARIAAINTAANAHVKPLSDRAQFGVEERWSYPTDRGDCEDYALLKRRLLHAAGIPLSDLLITVVRRRNGEGHAVLTLVSDRGDFILDNLDWRVKPWHETPYRFLKRQSAASPGRWNALELGAEMVVSAVAK